MSHALTPAPTNDTVTVPDPGDARTAASVGGPFQNVTNRTEYLRQRIPAGLSVTWQRPMTGVALDAGTGGLWARVGSLWVQSDVTGLATMYVDLDLPYNVTLDAVRLYLNGNGAGGGAHAGLPATKPTLTFNKLDTTASNSVVSTVTVTDAPGSLGAYETTHQVALTGMALFVDPAYRFQVKITGEAGANAANLKLTLYGLAVSWTPT